MTSTAWFPARAPTWTDVSMGVLAIFLLAVYLWSLETVVWVAAGLGFLATSVGLGPVARSAAGRWVGRWFRGIGLAGRVVVIVVFAVSVWTASWLLEPPAAPVTSFTCGAMLAIALYVAVHVLIARDVSGWRAT